MSFGGEDFIVGLVCLALVPLIGLRIVRGLSTGKLPLYRTYLKRADGEGNFVALLLVHVLTMLLVAFIAADLLLGLGLRGHG